MQTTKKRSYPKNKKALPYKKRQTKSITTKYQAKKKREIKTLDSVFPQNYVRVYISDAQTGFTFNDAGCIQNVVRTVQGAGIPNRIGNKIALKSLRIRGTLEVTGNGGTPPPQNARFMVIYDRQVNATYPALNTILSDVTSGNAIVNGDFLSSINPSFYDRYIVLCDKLFILGAMPLNSTDQGPTELKQFVIDEFIKLKGLEVVFTDSTVGGPIADISTGALYMIGWGDQANGNEPYYMNIKTRLRFYDN